MAREINLQNLLIELAIEARIEITWAIDDEDQDSLPSTNYTENENKVAEGLKFEENIKNYNSYPRFNKDWNKPDQNDLFADF
ncbi:9066_t:CDS:2 [Dentiscutata erythropus]|uniref:9066_t:CDS:1 n=1 Tax=Dentiscutata erythropus TaxID=1348616 RepID=A0A9N9EQM7_9GLOM|nr:9066_t:CDS:2 [Dentiscutata erythropus]